MPSKTTQSKQFMSCFFPFFAFFLLLSFILIFSSALVSAATGFTNDQDLYFTGTSTDPGTLYQDAMDGNSDAGIELCEAGSGYYAGAFYAINSGSWQYALISYSSFDSALAPATTPAGSCYRTSPGLLTVSPSQLTTPNPDVRKAAFPGRLYIGYASSPNPGTVSDFIYAGSNARLLGDYTVPRSFDQSDRTISITTPTITFTTSSGSFAKSASDSSFGINSERRMAIGVCDDDYGESCSYGSIYTSPSFPKMDSGLSVGEVNDQQIHTKYVVLNGIGKAMCIGANLQASFNSVTPDPVYYSQDLTIVFTLSNPRNSPYETLGGNVDVTTTFDVFLSIYNSSNPSQVVFSRTYTISDDLVSGGTLQRTVVWPAYAHSGFYTVRVVVDSGADIAECNEDDNIDTDTFELKAITTPVVHIDGVETNAFEYPNVPYNVDFHFKNSDDQVLANASVTIVETNGLNLIAPTQLYNRTTKETPYTAQEDALIVQSRITFRTDYYGNASFTFIPTYNRFYFPEYDYLNLHSRVGNYSLFLEGVEEDNNTFVFILDGEVAFQYPLSVTNPSYAGDYTKKTLSFENTAGQVMDFIYHAYSNFLSVVVG